ncbi:MAG: hypothetical protein IMX02_10260 [Limnochordaceae bacterium]|nr:hypothetical protein [Limnochordaceae bacterium]
MEPVDDLPEETARWLLYIAPYPEWDDGAIPPAGAILHFLNGAGDLIRWPPLVRLIGIDVRALPVDPSRLASALLAACYPVLLTVSFANCKNVVIRKAPEAPRRTSGKRPKDRRMLFTFRVLEIRPVRELPERQGRVRTVGIRRALHIVRGHFRDYRQGPGLFGKHNGFTGLTSMCGEPERWVPSGASSGVWPRKVSRSGSRTVQPDPSDWL